MESPCHILHPSSYVAADGSIWRSAASSQGRSLGLSAARSASSSGPTLNPGKVA
ncbi:hypothetical protein AAVH_40860, partial [Aphelenchoides avenae]